MPNVDTSGASSTQKYDFAQPAGAASSGPAPADRALKIAYIMSRFPKITETFILYEMLEQERNGHHVELFPLLRERQPVSHPEVERYLRRAHFHPFLSWKIVRANWHYFRRNPATYVKTVWEMLRGTFGSVNFFVGTLGIFPKSVRFACEMERAGVQHIHAHFCNHPAAAALIINRLTGIPFSFTAHGSDLHVERRMLDHKVRAAAFAVTISDFNKNVITDTCGGWAAEKVEVIHCGIDPEVFTPADPPAATGPIRLICVASFEEVKGHKVLVQACEILQGRGVDFVCDLIGDGPVRQEIAQQIAVSGLAARIKIHGTKPRPEVVAMLRRAHVKILPSVPTAGGKREGIPVVLMEAMAMELPVVSSRLSGIPELVESGTTGFLVPPHDAQGLADAVQKLAQDPALRRRMGRAGREKVVRDFDLRKNAAALGRLFKASAASDKQAARWPDGEAGNGQAPA